MIRLLEKMSVRGGSLYHKGELYSGPHEEWAVAQGIGERVEPSRPTKSMEAPAHHTMVVADTVRNKDYGRRKGRKGS